MSNTETRTDADELIVAMLCRWGDPFPGPNTWLCRYAWIAFTTEYPLDLDAVIADKLRWLDKPENTHERANLVGCVEHLSTIAAKPSRWQLPDNAFDPSDWFTPETR